MIEHILVGVDGSEGSRKAAAQARELAERLGARLTLLLALEPIPMVSIGFADAFGLTHRQLGSEELEQMNKSLDEMAQGFPADRLEKVIDYGNAAETICAQAEKRGADLIVVGARGLGAVGRFLLGSVSERVVRTAGRNVLVVH